MRDDAWKRYVASPLILCILFIFSATGSVLPYASKSRASSHQTEPRRAEYAPGQLIVKMKQGSPNVELLERYGLIVQEQIGRAGGLQVQSQSENLLRDLYVLRADEAADMEAIAAAVAAEPGVQYAEPNYRYTLDATPNDPFFAPPFTLNGQFYGHFSDGQWYLERCGFVEASERKSVTDTVVVNLDTGGSPTHEDLAGNTWQNDREANGVLGVDDDGNGFVDDHYGWNFVDDNSDIIDASGHGTLTSGLAAVSNNSKGIAGASNAKVMSPKVGKGLDIFIVPVLKAMSYAKVLLQRQGKRGVFNASWSGPDQSQALFETIRDSGMLFVASSGNHGREFPNTVHYPAGFNTELPNVLSVTGSTYDQDDRVADAFSFVGADLAAPGTWILTTDLGGGYRHTAGTSFSAPLVAHALAMVLDEVADPLVAKARILKSVDLRPVLAGKTRTGGRLNVARALAGHLNPNRAPEVSLDSFTLKGQEGVPIQITAGVSDPDGDFLAVTWRFSDGRTFTGNSIAPVFSLGNYQGTVTVSDGIAEVVLTVTIQVTDRVEVRPKLKGAKKLILTVTSSRQNQNPRPRVVIRELNREIPYDEQSQAYRIVFKIKKNPVPSPLTVESDLGGTFTLSWR